MKNSLLFVCLFLVSPFLFAGGASKWTSIYETRIDTEFTHNIRADDSKKGVGEQFNFTSGQVKLTIENKTIIDLAFSTVNVRHHCNKMPSDYPTTNPNYHDFKYIFDASNKDIGSGKSHSQIVKTYDDKKKGPCSGGFGGVARSEIIDVDFHQYDMIPYNQKMLCGDERVPMVWAKRKNETIFLLYWASSKKVYSAKELHSADGMLMLKNDICNGLASDKATEQRFSTRVISQIKKWISACDKYFDLCNKKYEKVYRKKYREDVGSIRD